MNIFISHFSALEYWQAQTSLKACSPTRAKPTMNDVPTRKSLELLRADIPQHLSFPLHLTVSHATKRRKLQNVECHVLNAKMPLGSFKRITPHVFVSSPETTLFQIASTLLPIEVAQIGYEFCGNYMYDSDSDHGFKSREPLSSAESIQKFVGKIEGTRGASSFSKTVRHIVDMSASPMETALTLLLCLPIGEGGYGFELPVLNHRIELTGSVRRYADKQNYVCDLFWPDSRIDLEYDSDMFHTASEQITADAKKRNTLQTMGLSVITVTRRQIYDVREFDRVAHELAKRMGRRMRIKSPKHHAKQSELRSILLY